MVATDELPAEKFRVPMEDSQVGIDDRGTCAPLIVGSGHANFGFAEEVTEAGAQSSTC